MTDLDIDPIRSGNYDLLLKARMTPATSNQQDVEEKSMRLLIKEGAMSLRSMLNHIHCEDVTGTQSLRISVLVWRGQFMVERIAG